MFLRPSPREDRGHTRRAVAKNRFKPLASRGHIADKRVGLDNFPTAAVNKYKQRQYRLHNRHWRELPPSEKVDARAALRQWGEFRSHRARSGKLAQRRVLVRIGTLMANTGLKFAFA